MAGNIKGIIVEIGGDTSGLKKALRELNGPINDLNKELKGVNSLLKFDPKNTELLSQKQTLLGKSIEETEKKLKALNEGLAKADFSKTPEENIRFVQREIVATQEKLKSLKLEASSWTSASRSLDAIGNTLTSLGNGITEIGKKASIASVAVGTLFATGIKYNADIETATKSYEAFLGSAEEAEEAVKAIRDQSKTSPFDSAELIKANQYLVSAEINAEDARKTISALADAIALTGGGNDELGRMALNLQQIKNQRTSNCYGY